MRRHIVSVEAGATAELTKVTCRCVMCRKDKTIEMPTGGFLALNNGVSVQEAIPTVPPAERELLISGTCGDCWDDMFGAGPCRTEPQEEVFEMGNMVVCDLCNKNWTNQPGSGGFLFGSKAVCPDCAPEFRKQVNANGEQHMITKECPPDKSFNQWVVEDLRGGKPGRITITKIG